MDLRILLDEERLNNEALAAELRNAWAYTEELQQRLLRQEQTLSELREQNRRQSQMIGSLCDDNLEMGQRIEVLENLATYTLRVN